MEWTYETRRVVITDGLGVAERFQDGIGLNDLILQGAFLLGWIVRFLGRGTDGGEVRDYFFRVLGLPCTGLTGDQHGLILTVCKRKKRGREISFFRLLEETNDTRYILLVSILT